MKTDRQTDSVVVFDADIAPVEGCRRVRVADMLWRFGPVAREASEAPSRLIGGSPPSTSGMSRVDYR